WKSRASVASLWLGASSRVTTLRARRAVSMTWNDGHGRPCASAAALRKPMSNGELCATSTQPRANARKAGSTFRMLGAWATIASVIPVSTAMKAGTGAPGLTRLWNSPSHSPPLTLTAPTSVIPASPGLPPVVSRSTTQNVTSDSGVPRSSSLVCTPRGGTSVRTGGRDPPERGGPPTTDAPLDPDMLLDEGVASTVMAHTLGVTTDIRGVRHAAVVGVPWHATHGDGTRHAHAG